VKRTLLALALLLLSPSAFAWGEKGHTLVNEAATLGLPADMPQFFLRAFPELTYFGPEPDRIKNAGDSQDAVNLPDHQIDLEEVYVTPLPHSRYAFINAMMKADAYRLHGIASDRPGFLPWRIAELSQYLQKLFSMWRTTSDFVERRAIQDEILVVAGLLGHYAGDASNPHHTTVNYNGWVTYPNPNGYVNDCEIHTRFETQFISHAITREDVIPRVAAPQLRTDYFAAGLATITESNSLVERLYQIDKTHGFDVLRPVQPEAKEFAVQRLAAGAALLRDLWWSALKNSSVPTGRRGPRP
jgi:hypothetical protein